MQKTQHSFTEHSKLKVQINKTVFRIEFEVRTTFRLKSHKLINEFSCRLDDRLFPNKTCSIIVLFSFFFHHKNGTWPTIYARFTLITKQRAFLNHRTNRSKSARQILRKATILIFWSRHAH